MCTQQTSCGLCYLLVIAASVRQRECLGYRFILDGVACFFVCFLFFMFALFGRVGMLCVHITGDPGCKKISIYCLMFKHSSTRLSHMNEGMKGVQYI